MSLMFIRVFAGFLAGLAAGILIMRIAYKKSHVIESWRTRDGPRGDDYDQSKLAIAEATRKACGTMHSGRWQALQPMVALARAAIR